jgi:hypothetical protein
LLKKLNLLFIAALHGFRRVAQLHHVEPDPRAIQSTQTLQKSLKRVSARA